MLAAASLTNWPSDEELSCFAVSVKNLLKLCDANLMLIMFTSLLHLMSHKQLIG